MNRCGFGPQCGAHFAGGGGGAGWLAVLDSIALWALAIVAILFLLGLRRRPRHWGRGGMPRGNASYQVRGGGPDPRGWAGWGPGAAPAGPPAPPHLAQAEATLAERFSRGEITAEQYRNGIDVLRGQSTAAPAPAVYPEPQQAPADPEAPLS